MRSIGMTSGAESAAPAGVPTLKLRLSRGTAADTDDFDDCEVVLRCCHVEGLSPRVTCRRFAGECDPTTDAEWDGP